MARMVSGRSSATVTLTSGAALAFGSGWPNRRIRDPICGVYPAWGGETPVRRRGLAQRSTVGHVLFNGEVQQEDAT